MRALKFIGECLLMAFIWLGSISLFRIDLGPLNAHPYATCLVMGLLHTLARRGTAYMETHGYLLAGRLQLVYVELRAYWWALQVRMIAFYWLMRRTLVLLRHAFPRAARRPKQPLTILSIPTGELRTLLVRCPMCGRLQLVWVHRHVDGYTLFCENDDGCGQVTVKLP